ncbi:MAG: hypothetical protein OJF47_003594 [Nitrospira sp.]|nr:MAG: hypothetical protein OJF47_003594 [Nitrospira sp.]
MNDSGPSVKVVIHPAQWSFVGCIQCVEEFSPTRSRLTVVPVDR